MPETTAELVDLLDLEEIEIGLYRGQHPVTNWQRTFGGQVLAQALMAADHTVDDSRVCHSLNSYFLRPGSTSGPIIYDVENLRDGGSMSSRRVLARQGGQVIFTMSASFQTVEDGLEHSDPMPTDVPCPDQCPAMASVLAERFGYASPLWHEWDALDVRFAGEADDIPAPHHHAAHLRVWVRTTDDLPEDPRLHQAVAAYLSDMTLLSVATSPHRMSFLSRKVQAASIDHAMWFHRPLRADRWLLYDQTSPSAAHSRGFSMGRLLQGDVLVASCAQEGLIRVRP